MSSLQFKDLLINFTTEFHLLWNDKGSGAHKSASFWRPEISANHLNNFFSLGDIALKATARSTTAGSSRSSATPTPQTVPPCAHPSS